MRHVPLTEAKLHHQISQRYMLRFSPDGKHVHVFDRMTRRFRFDGVRNVAAETEFYTATTRDGVKERWAEVRLGEIDGAVTLFEKLERREELTQEERWHVAFFAGFAEARSAGFRNDARSDALMFRTATDDQRRRFENAFQAMTGIWMSFDSLEQLARDDSAHIAEGLDDLSNMAAAGMQLSIKLFWTQWLVGFAPDDHPFITSDRPLALLEREQRGRFGDDPLDPNVICVLPLSRRCALVMGIPVAEPSLRFADVDSGFVRLVNASLARRAHRSIIAHDERLLRRSIEDAGITIIPSENERER